MPKRYTDTDIWKKQRWFKRLSVDYKLAFMYIKDQCNHAGIWSVDVLSLCEDIGFESFNLHEFMDMCNRDFDKIDGSPVIKERFILLNNSQLWITSFLRFQYESKDFMINESIPSVKSALEILKGYNILTQALDKGYITLKKGTERDKDKDKDKDISSNTNSLTTKEETVFRKFKHLSISDDEVAKLKIIGYSQDQINDVLNSIENYKKNSSYTSLYLTAIKWLKKEHPSVTQPKLGEKIPMPDDEYEDYIRPKNHLQSA